MSTTTYDCARAHARRGARDDHTLSLQFTLVLKFGRATINMFTIFSRFEAPYIWYVGWNRLEWTWTIIMLTRQKAPHSRYLYIISAILC
jgi:hypothetical protein